MKSLRQVALEAAANEFIRKVDAGEAKSVKSYAAFTAALELPDDVVVKQATPKEFYQSHSAEGCNATITVEWSWPEDNTPPEHWQEMAQHFAEKAFEPGTPYIRDIVYALRGRTAR